MSDLRDSNYPRLAIVSSNPIRNDQANGILMRSLFQDWPRQKLSQLYFSVAVTNAPDNAICEQYRLIRLTGRTLRVSGTTETSAASVSSAFSPTSLESGPLKRRATNFVTRQQKLMRYLRFGLESWYAHSHLGKVLESQLRELRPEGVYALLGNYYLTKITYLACQRLGLPLYIHITDDFVRALYQDIPFSRRMSDASEEWLQRAVNYSMGRAAISPVMAEQFELRYGRPWDWFTTLISAEDYDPSPRLPDGKLRLVFAGNLGLQRWQSLARLAQALRNLPREANLLPVLEIYGSPAQLARHREALFVPGITELKGWVAPHELPNIFHSADVLVHAESFDADVAEYTKLSFSTKLSQYMMARRPILAVGPDHLGSLQMVRKARAGVTIAAEDTTDFAQQLLVALSDPASLSEMGDHGRRWAMQYVDRVDGHRRFRDSIIDSMTRQNAAA